MKASLIIPVWNGASVITECLEALFAHCGSELLEVICVDNASTDDSPAIIEQFIARAADHTLPPLRLLRQPVNLGFSGGVNAGIQAARGDILALLNQDCLVQPGWLAALLQALDENPSIGIMGSVIYNADGSLNHAGARIDPVRVRSTHMTALPAPPGAELSPVLNAEFVTGAAMAIRRSTLEKVGIFDEGYYPAYFEDADYCYRARRKGIETGCALSARASHLFSNRAWQSDPFKHTTNGYVARYRFMCKHTSEQTLPGFFEFELGELATATYMDHVLGRIIATNFTLSNLPAILERRREDLGDEISPTATRQLQSGLSAIVQGGLLRAGELLQASVSTAAMDEEALAAQRWDHLRGSLRDLYQREIDLLEVLYFLEPSGTGVSPGQAAPSRMQHFSWGLRRLRSLFSGRERQLLNERQAILRQRLQMVIEFSNQVHPQTTRTAREISERLRLLELLTEYDYRYR